MLDENKVLVCEFATATRLEPPLEMFMRENGETEV
jgi:hypothetical protein